LSLDGNYRWADTDANFAGSSGHTNVATIALQLKFPIYLAGSINLRTEQAGLQYNQSERLAEEARRAASAEATSAFLDVSSGVSRVEALFDAITAGESALEAKEEGFNAGLTTNLDVLDAQRDLSQSRTDYLRARYTYILSVLELERAAGKLNEEDITRVNNWLGE
jgi:outer membrane protein TolC